MQDVFINSANFDSIVAQAEDDFPYETCGFVIGDDRIEEVRPILNIQNRKHSEDPASFPRDARTAYLMEPKQHLTVMREIDQRKLRLKIVYHSHPEHDAYFSPTDRAQACTFDPAEPDYPDTAYVVISVMAGKFNRAAAYVWDTGSKQFVETFLRRP